MSNTDWRDRFSDMANEQLYMLDNQIDTDCTINVNVENVQTSIKAHKNHLQRESTVFSEMLNKSNNSSIDIFDLKLLVVHQLIRFMYGAKNLPENIEVEDVLELIMAAEKFKIDRLVKTFYNIFKEKYMTCNNIFKIKIYFDKTKHFSPIFADLEGNLLQIIKNETKEFFRLESALDINKEHLEKIVQLDNLSLDNELELLNFVDKWALHQVDKISQENRPSATKRQRVSHTKPPNIRKLVDNIIPFLRFLTLNVNMYNAYVDKYIWLSIEEKHAILKGILTKNYDDLPLSICHETEIRCGLHLFEISSSDMELPGPRVVSSLIFSVNENMKIHSIKMESKVKIFSCDGTMDDKYDESLVVTLSPCSSNSNTFTSVPIVQNFIDKVSYNSFIDVKFDTPYHLFKNSEYYLEIKTNVPGNYIENRNFFKTAQALEFSFQNTVVVIITCLKSFETFESVNPELIHDLKLIKL